MMFKKIVIIAIAIIALFLLMSCDSNEPNKALVPVTPTHTPSTTKSPATPTPTHTPSATNSLVVPTITRADAVAEIEWFRTFLYDNYPYHGVIERKLGYTVQDVLNDLRDTVLDDARTEIPMQEYFELMLLASDRFNGIGHLDVFSKNFYQLNILRFEDWSLLAEKNPMTYRVLTDESTSSVYATLKDPQVNAPVTNSRAYAKEFYTEIKDNNTLYIRVSNFDRNINDDYTVIQDFLKTHQDKDTLIIDITGNGGGIDQYWISNLVMPFLDEKMEYSAYSFAKDGQYNLEFFEGFDTGVNRSVYAYRNQTPITRDIIDTFQNANTFDFDELDIFFPDAEGYSFDPDEDGPIWTGQIYLLVDEWVYSSAEAFSIFCKQTGFATLIGRTTRGDGIGTSPVYCTMPYSHLAFRYEAVYGVRADGASSSEFGTTPDVLCQENETPFETCMRVISND